MAKFLFRFFTTLHAKFYKLTGGRAFGGGTRSGSVIVLTHRGAKTGKVRDTPLMFVQDGENYLVIASAGGSDNHPGWYHNLRAHPETTINVAGKEIPVMAHFSDGAERDRLWDLVVSTDERFAKYASNTDRVIPVVALQPR